MKQAAAAARRQLPSFRPAELATLLWSLASLGYAPRTPPDAWLAPLVRDALGALPPGLLTRTDIVMLAFALARLEWPPPAAWLAALTAASTPQLPALPAAELATTVWGLAHCGTRLADARWNAAALAAVAARLDEFDVASLTQLHQALRFLPPPPLAAAGVAATAGSAAGAAGAGPSGDGGGGAEPAPPPSARELQARAGALRAELEARLAAARARADGGGRES